MPDFTPWPSIPRLFRDCTVTEKIDGSNAAIVIKAIGPAGLHADYEGKSVVVRDTWVVYAQSRSRCIHPGDDNYKFAAWVWKNAEALVDELGEGIHFGEWWGSGINRGYGIEKGVKFFSLFNTKRWGELQDGTSRVPGLYAVPVLYEGPFSWEAIGVAAEKLSLDGSLAAPGYDRPEGIVIYHHAANQCFKFTFGGDGHKKDKA